MRELFEVISAWLHGDGDLPGLLLAWWQTITRRVTPDTRASWPASTRW